MKSILLCTILASVRVCGFCQLMPTAGGVTDYQSNSLKEMPSKPVSVKSSVYLNDEWRKSEMQIRSGSDEAVVVRNVDIKLDLRTDNFDVNTDKGIKILDGSRVYNFTWKLDDGKEEKFVKCSQFKYDDASLSGFCKITGQSLKLITQYDAAMIKANYNVALDVGSKSDRWTRRAHLFLAQGDRLVKFTRKSFFKAVGDDEQVVRKYLSDNGLTLSQEEDILKAVSFYNTLTP